MTNANLQLVHNQEAEAVTQAYTVDVSKGNMDGRVSKQWSSRPDDEKYLDLNSLLESVAKRNQESTEFKAAFQHMRVNHENGLSINVDGIEKPVEFTNWSFGQLCALTKTPASYLRQLPNKLAAINLQYGLMNTDETRKAYVRQNGVTQLRAMTSDTYGRVYDHDVIKQVMRVAGNGTGESRWKVPGMLDWSSRDSSGLVKYNPFVDVTKETTTLYASDRDVYIFLVDDTHPIEVGKLHNGEPDLMFRGFIVWNSETGSKTFGMSTMLLRGVCCNRNLWGVGETHDLKIKHSSLAPERFAYKAAPMLEQYANMPAAPIAAKVWASKQAIVARNDEERLEFAHKKVGLTKSMSERVMDAVLNEEQHKAESVFDFVQGITAVARGIQHQDDRLTLEMKAGKLMDAIKV